MATLLSAVSANGAGTGASHTGPCTVHAQSDSVFDGAIVHIQMADSDTAGEYADIGDYRTHLRGPGSIAVNAQGTYFLRAFVEKVGTSTSLTVTTTQ